MEALDPLALIEWIYDPLEERFGRLVAWLATLASALGLVCILVWIFIEVTFSLASAFHPIGRLRSTHCRA
jgi:Na+/melibiose symporter-like transporter